MVAQVTELIAYPLRTAPLPAVGAQVALLDLRHMPAADSLGMVCLTQQFLSPAERGELAALGHPLRRREWLAARVCLKTLLVRHGWIDDALDCEVHKDGRGRPSLAPRSDRCVALPDCSLSHAPDWACAAVAACGRVGIDIERISPRVSRLAGAFIGGHEAACRGDRAADEQRTIWWALKEAYSKTVGLGLGLPLVEIECRETAEGVHRLNAPDSPECRGWHVVHEDCVLALCQHESPAGR